MAASSSSSAAASTPQVTVHEVAKTVRLMCKNVQQRAVWFAWRTNNDDTSDKWEPPAPRQWSSGTVAELCDFIAPLKGSNSVLAGRQPVALVAVNENGSYGNLDNTYTSRRLQEWTPSATDAQCLFTRHEKTGEPTHMLVFTFPPLPPTVPVQPGVFNYLL